MAPKNLAIVFAPNIAQIDEKDYAGQCTDVTEFLQRCIGSRQRKRR
jgi:hypothetical protein